MPACNNNLKDITYAHETQAQARPDEAQRRQVLTVEKAVTDIVDTTIRAMCRNYVFGRHARDNAIAAGIRTSTATQETQLIAIKRNLTKGMMQVDCIAYCGDMNLMMKHPQWVRHQS